MMNSFFAPPDVAESPREVRRRVAARTSFGSIWLLGLAGHIITHYSGLRLALGLAALVAFLVGFYAVFLFTPSFSEPLGGRAWAAMAVFTAMAVGLPPAFGNEWLALPMYLTITYAMRLPFQIAFWGVLAGVGLYGVEGILTDADSGTTWSLMGSALGIGLIMLGFRHSRMLVAELQQARGEVARLAATEERLRIARDLHDLLGHSLSLIVLKSELARRMAERDPSRTAAEVTDIESVARQALADVREAVSGYRQRDLAEELDHARRVLAAAGVEPVITTSGTPLPDLVDGLFGWAVREGVTNVVRHAGARRCSINLSRTGQDALLEIVDDGAGGAAGSAPGNGLTGLAERIGAAGGEVESGPVPGGGFRLAVRVPVASPRAEASVESQV